jgi:hypothetical protein
MGRLKLAGAGLAVAVMSMTVSACTLPFGGSGPATAVGHKLPFEDGGAAVFLGEIREKAGGGEVQVTRVLFYPDHASFTVVAGKAGDLDDYSWNKTTGWSAATAQKMSDTSRDLARKAAFNLSEIKPEVLPGLKAKADAVKPPNVTSYFIIERSVFEQNAVVWNAYVSGDRDSFRLVADTSGNVIKQV